MLHNGVPVVSCSHSWFCLWPRKGWSGLILTDITEELQTSTFGSKLGPCGPTSLGGVEFTVFNLGGWSSIQRWRNKPNTQFSLLELPLRFSPESVQLTSNSLTSIFPRGQKCRTPEASRKGKSTVVEKSWKVSFCLKEGYFIFVVVRGSSLRISAL